jgi:hypothetical protein
MGETGGFDIDKNQVHANRALQAVFNDLKEGTNRPFKSQG